jgi:hypothetical protein
MKSIALKMMALLFFAAFFLSAHGKPGDSVDSGSALGRSRFDISSGGPLRFFPMFTNILLGSQSEGDFFTDYGPFINISESILKIELERRGGANHDGVSGTVDGAEAARGNRKISFTVLPGQNFHFSAKDYTALSVFSTMATLTPPEAGLPTADNFLHPKGIFHACFEDVPGMDFATGEFGLMKYYTYVRGSMSDRSSRTTDIYWNGFLVGPKPDFEPVCERYQS